MRTPGDDFDLAIGYLLTEGIIEEAAAVHQAMHCLDEDESGAPTHNVVDIMLVEERPSTRAGRAPPTPPAPAACGKDQHRRHHHSEPVCRGEGRRARRAVRRGEA